MNQDEIKEILDNHALWLTGDGGERANLYGANLYGADLCRADLREANLCRADLYGANLYGANLYGANLYGANLHGADLRRADLREANLYGANLYGANLHEADLREADLCRADSVFPIACPGDGSFIGWKKVNGGLIVKLEITETARRSSATTRKCRCSEAKVLEIQHKDGTAADVESATSTYDNNFTYKVGKIVSINNFDNDRWNECSTGIHFFITRQEAVDY